MQTLIYQRSNKEFDEKSIPNVTISNICGLIKLNISNIDLIDLASKMANSSYNPRRVPALVIRKSKPKSTVLLFRTGKALVFGLSTVQDFDNLSFKLAKQLEKLMLIKKIVVEYAQITNILCICNLNFRINLGKLSEHRLAVKRQNFSGVLYKIGKPIKSALIFQNGKIVMMGAKSTQDIYTAFGILQNQMRQYKMLNTKQKISIAEDNESNDQTHADY